MKNKKAFTILEMVIVLAVASILFAIIAGLSIATNSIFASQKATTESLAEFKSAKAEIEKFMSTYSYDYYSINLTENSAEIYYIQNDNNENEGNLAETAGSKMVSKLEFDKEKFELNIYLVDENDILTLESKKAFSHINNIVFSVNENLKLLKCDFEIENNNNYNFLINLGGMEIGNLY